METVRPGSPLAQTRVHRGVCDLINPLSSQASKERVIILGVSASLVDFHFRPLFLPSVYAHVKSLSFWEQISMKFGKFIEIFSNHIALVKDRRQ
jgi:hypothetical protein